MYQSIHTRADFDSRGSYNDVVINRNRAFYLAEIDLHPFSAQRARGTMRLLHEVVGSLLTCLGVKDTLRSDRFYESSSRD